MSFDHMRSVLYDNHLCGPPECMPIVVLLLLLWIEYGINERPKKSAWSDHYRCGFWDPNDQWLKTDEKVGALMVIKQLDERQTGGMVDWSEVGSDVVRTVHMKIYSSSLSYLPLVWNEYDIRFSVLFWICTVCLHESTVDWLVKRMPYWKIRG